MKNDRRMRAVECLIFSDGSALSLGDCFVSKSIFGFLPPIQLSAPDVNLFSDAGTKLLNFITLPLRSLVKYYIIALRASVRWQHLVYVSPWITCNHLVASRGGDHPENCPAVTFKLSEH